jgi:hypothetical protein
MILEAVKCAEERAMHKGKKFRVRGLVTDRSYALKVFVIVRPLSSRSVSIREGILGYHLHVAT